MSNFDQTIPAEEGRLTVSGRTGCAMSKTDDFWQYAKEAVLSASHTENEEEKHSFLDLARTWIQAALMERRSNNRIA